MASVKQLEEQIFQKEGFRVKLTPLDAKVRSVAPYLFEYMGSNKWRVSDWKRERLAEYIAQFRAIEIFRGDGTALKSDMRLGNLRDSYFEAAYAPKAEASDSRVVPLRSRARRT